MAQTHPERAPERRQLRRILCLMLLFGVASFLVLIARLYRLQIVDHDYYESLAVAQQLREAPTVIARGSIFDRRGKPLALSASVENVFLSPAEIDQSGGPRADRPRPLGDPRPGRADDPGKEPHERLVVRDAQALAGAG